MTLNVSGNNVDATVRSSNEGYTVYVIEPKNAIVNGWTFEKGVLFQHENMATEISFYAKYVDGVKYDFEILKNDGAIFTGDDDAKEAYIFALNSISSKSSIQEVISADMRNGTYLVELRNRDLIK